MTLSITGRCARTGHLGSAVTSGNFRWTLLPSHTSACDLAGLTVAVGGVGAVTAQASSPPAITTSVIAYLRRGLNADEALQATLAQHADELREQCQVAVVDATGDAAGFTGHRPLEWRGHKSGDGWVAAGNILASGRVVDAMAEAFETNAHQPLDKRLLTALEAGVAAGGDRRGHRGAMLRLATGIYVSDVEIRVHEHANPVAELGRLLTLFHAEADIEQVAVRAFTAVRGCLGEPRIAEFAGLSVQQAIEALRGALLEEPAPVEAVRAVDDLLSALADQPELQKSQFGSALALLTSIAPPATGQGS